MKLNEKNIQQSIFDHILEKGRRWIIPNIYFFTNESDILAELMSGYLEEYEIKISKSDFKHDFKKKKHKLFEKLMKKDKRVRKNSTPNYFSFVVPKDLISIDDVPDYAGLYYVWDNLYLEQIKKPKMLHNNKIMNEKKRIEISRKFTYRYWKRHLLS